MPYSRKQQEMPAPAHHPGSEKPRNGVVHQPPVYGVGVADGPVIQLKKKEDEDLKKKKPLQRKVKEEEDLKKKKPIQRKKKDEDDLKKKKPIQRKAQPGDSAILIDPPDSPLEKEADAVAEQVVRRMSAPGSADMEPVRAPAGHISRAAAGGDAGVMHAPAYVASELEASRGQGQPLPETLRTDIEGVIGSDLSGVRIHTDAKAAELSEAVNAQAFTYREDVYFNAGKYRPGGVEGRRLLGHEVGHVGQQNKQNYFQKIHRIDKDDRLIPKSEIINAVSEANKYIDYIYECYDFASEFRVFPEEYDRAVGQIKKINDYVENKIGIYEDGNKIINFIQSIYNLAKSKDINTIIKSIQTINDIGSDILSKISPTFSFIGPVINAYLEIGGQALIRAKAIFEEHHRKLNKADTNYPDYERRWKIESYLASRYPGDWKNPAEIKAQQESEAKEYMEYYKKQEELSKKEEEKIAMLNTFIPIYIQEKRKKLINKLLLKIKNSHGKELIDYQKYWTCLTPGILNQNQEFEEEDDFENFKNTEPIKDTIDKEEAIEEIRKFQKTRCPEFLNEYNEFTNRFKR